MITTVKSFNSPATDKIYESIFDQFILFSFPQIFASLGANVISLFYS